jgi:tetratricopeptide (TPR) repeat protein
MHAIPSLMNRQILKSLSLIAFLFLYSVNALASAEVEYNKGVEFFKKGNYHAAINKFESARKKGMASASLYYNLGSSYFKIEKYSTSKLYFTQVTQFPDKRVLAEYNLGLIAVKENNKEVALRHFNYVVKMGNENKLVLLSKRKIASIESAYKSWLAFFAVDVGYDDNINISPNDLTQGISDTFYNLYTSADYVVSGKRKNGWLIDASYIRIDFSDGTDYDQDFYTFGIRNEYRLYRWDTKTHITSGKSTFGGDDLQTFYKLELLGINPLSKNEKVILRYWYEEYSSENINYDYLEGWRQRARIGYRRNLKKNNLQIYYEAEVNDRGEYITSTYSYNYSPTRHTVRGKYIHELTDKWIITNDLSYRISDFPASATLDRDETKWALALSVDYRIDTKLKIHSKLKFMENDSSVDTYNYDKSIITIGVKKLF